MKASIRRPSLAAAPDLSGPTPQHRTRIVVVVIAVAGAATALGLSGVGERVVRAVMNRVVPLADPDDGVSFSSLRAAHKDTLRRTGPTPKPTATLTAARGFDVVRYPAPGDRSLQAFLRRPAVVDGATAPALVYLHGGFALSEKDIDDVKAAVDAAFFVMLPSLRGENGNAGDFSLFYGEVDDAAAAVRFLAAQPGVDPQRVFVVGHSIGGGLAALLSLVDDVPAAMTASIDGLYTKDVCAWWSSVAPLDVADDDEACRLRVFTPHLRRLKRKHIAYAGDADDSAPLARRVSREAKGQPWPIEIVFVPGDHFASVAPAMNAFVHRADVAGGARR